MKLTIDKTWIVTLDDGRQVTIGAGIDEDRGVWLLSSAPLLRWMTSGDAGRIADALRAAGEHMDAHPPQPRKRRRR